MENSDNEPIFEYEYSENYPNQEAFKYRLISYNTVKIQIHLNNSVTNNQMTGSNEESKERSADLDNHLNIFDINVMTRAKSENELLQMIAKELGWEDLKWEETQNTPMYRSYNPFRLQHSNVNFSYEVADWSQRKKNDKLSREQRLFLLDWIRFSGFSLQQISVKYFISSSVLYKIKREWENNPTNFKKRSIIKLGNREQSMLARLINEYDAANSFPYTCFDVQSYISKAASRVYPIHILKSIMKERWGLSYKRVKKRPNSISLSHIRLWRKLFAIIFWKLLKSETLLINIDEWVINYQTSELYSWSKIGQEKECLSMPIKGSVCLWMAVLSNGAWYWMTTNQTINSQKFSSFIARLNYWLEENNFFGNKNIVTFMDNWPSHKEKNTKVNLKLLKGYKVFLSPYSPSLAPIENWFGYLKKKLLKQSRNITVKLHQQNSNYEVGQALNHLDSTIIQNTFKHFYGEIKKALKYSSFGLVFINLYVDIIVSQFTFKISLFSIHLWMYNKC